MIGCHEVIEARLQLLMAVVMKAFDSCFLDRPVHSLYLTIGLGVIGFCQAMPDTLALQIMLERIERDHAEPRLRGCSANWMPLSVRIV
ncbi:hypothetical protein KSAC_34050 (plasmid) [Komagataeibacter saccharivorans]|nr:hypothetical protein KSAC_34050 [Komagataeibacter saccharivorans]